MKITVKREFFTDTETIGSMFINDKFFCYTLEDKDRKLNQLQLESEIKAQKKFGITAIPSGTYRVILTLSNRFKRVMPEVLKVKGFLGIRIHGGNTHKNTEGCILVAKNKHINKPFGKFMNWIQGSTEVRLVKEISKAIQNNEKVELQIVY
jgi:hypothetical protein